MGWDRIAATEATTGAGHNRAGYGRAESRAPVWCAHELG